MEAIESEFEIRAHLDFVDEDEIAFAFLVAAFDVFVKGVVFAVFFGIDTREVDASDDGVGVGVFQEAFKFAQKEGFAAAANTGDDLDVLGADDASELIEVITMDFFHESIIACVSQKSKFCEFAKWRFGCL